MTSSLQLVSLDDRPGSFLPACCRLLGLDYVHYDYPAWLKDGKHMEQFEQPVLLLGRCESPVAIDRMLQRLAEQQPALTVIDSGLGAEEWQRLPASLQALRVGTLAQEFSYAELADVLHRAQAFRQSRLALRTGPNSAAQEDQGLLGVSDLVQHTRQMIVKVGQRDVSVLITGESGTGKEVVARSLHENSGRRDGPFVPINCGAIPVDLLESELFGHEKGAFTGAVNSRAGRFEMANGGTLFLDEIGDMPLNMQVKLLRVLQERCFERVGGTRTLEADVRVIAATHKNLEAMIARNEFREDLYFRLNVFPIEMAPLRDRVEDIPVLLDEMVRRTEQQGLGKVLFHPSAIRSLQRHPWPGNVRELANLVERLVIMYPDGVVGVSELPSKFRHIDEPDPGRYAAPAAPDLTVVVGSAGAAASAQLPADGMNLKQHLEAIERSLIGQALDQADNVVARAADLLQVRRTTLVEKMRKYGIQRK